MSSFICRRFIKNTASFRPNSSFAEVVVAFLVPSHLIRNPATNTHSYVHLAVLLNTPRNNLTYLTTSSKLKPLQFLHDDVSHLRHSQVTRRGPGKRTLCSASVGDMLCVCFGWPRRDKHKNPSSRQFQLHALYHEHR